MVGYVYPIFEWKSTLNQNKVRLVNSKGVYSNKNSEKETRIIKKINYLLQSSSALFLL